MGTATASAGTFQYKRHEPEKTLLYQVLARDWETWLAERQADTSRTPLPTYVLREFEAFFRCGLLQYGFIILSCEGCGDQMPVAFSCKNRGFCPSCSAKRMSETAVHLIDNVLPHVPYRQWVTTFPHTLRFWMAASRKLTNMVHQLVSARITHYYVHAAEERGIKEPQHGGVTFVQRFGSALNLNIHLHTVAIEGVFSVSGPTPLGRKDGDMAHVEGQLGQTALHIGPVLIPPDQRLHGEAVTQIVNAGSATLLIPHLGSLEEMIDGVLKSGLAVGMCGTAVAVT